MIRVRTPGVIVICLFLSSGIFIRPGAWGAGPAADAAYRDACGGCHYAYQPFLLPSASWKNMISKLPDHFGGESVDLDAETRGIIANYLMGNAAERSTYRRAAKMYASLNGKVPERITDIPYILHKHHGIKKEILNRASVGSLANCIACHKTAEKGIYEGDSVQIPK